MLKKPKTANTLFPKNSGEKFLILKEKGSQMCTDSQGKLNMGSAIKLIELESKIYQKTEFATMEPLSRRWLILASLPRSWLAFARYCMAILSGYHGFEHWARMTSDFGESDSLGSHQGKKLVN